MPQYPFPLRTLPHFSEFLVAEHVILPHELQQINQLWIDEKSADAELEGGQDEELRKSSVMPLESGGAHNWIFERMMHKVLEANNFYTNQAKYKAKLSLQGP